jgi:protein gp37
MAETSIEWSDWTWNPLRGCTRASEGCRNCYAERVAARFSDPGRPFHGIAKRTPSGPRWTGKIELVEHALSLPLKRLEGKLPQGHGKPMSVPVILESKNA